MKLKRNSGVFLLFAAVLIMGALFIYACSSSESNDDDGGSTGMELTKASVCEETTNLMDVAELGDYSNFLGFADTAGAKKLVVDNKFLTQSSLKVLRTILKFKDPISLADEAEDCPVYTYDPPIETWGALIPEEFTIIIDYGEGCDPDGSGNIISGSITLVVSNFETTLDTISCGYSLTLDSLASGGTTSDGKVSGEIEVTIDNATDAMSGIASADFENLTDGENTLNGSVTLELDNVSLVDSTGTISMNIDDFTAGGGVYSGSIIVTMESATSTTLDIDISSSTEDINVTIVATTSVDGTVTTLNTPTTGTYKGFTFTIDDVVIDSNAECEEEPVSGSVTWADNAGNSITVLFDGECDGYDVSMNGGPYTSCSSEL